MKIKTKIKPYDEVINLPRPKHRHPRKQSPILRKAMNAVSNPDLKNVDFELKTGDMKGINENEPALYLMNHSCFTDLEISTRAIHGSYNIVCTSDGFVGKEGLMRAMGCIPTEKFQPDIRLIKDISYSLKKLKSSVLMYPEASYSFDGTATPLPVSLGKLIKALGFPVIMIRTHGAFIHDPLYNGLRVRQNKITAEKYTLFTPNELSGVKAPEINSKLKEAFTFDNFAEQLSSKTLISEDFRAEGLSRVLYKCPVCGTEGKMTSHRTAITCEECKTKWLLSELGQMEIIDKAFDGKTAAPQLFKHIPDWYAWERECVKKELEDGSYSLDIPVKIRMMVDYKAIYEVGDGTLTHNSEGFHLSGCEGKLEFTQKPLASYSLYSDYFWYELGDMICIGDKEKLFYCFPSEEMDVVAKTRLAAEELYKLKKNAFRFGFFPSP